MNPIWSLISGVVQPVTNLIDKLHTSEEEKLQARAALVGLQVQLTEKMLDYEARLLEAQSSVIKAEATGRGVLQRNWRPITMLTFLALVVADTLGYTEFRLSEQAWELLKIGLGGYVIGRSAEKIAPTIASAMKKD